MIILQMSKDSPLKALVFQVCTERSNDNVLEQVIYVGVGLMDYLVTN